MAISRTIIRAVALRPASLRLAPASPILPAMQSRCSSSIPTIAQPSFWKAMIPKPLRKDQSSTKKAKAKKPQSKDWNPATFYIVIFLFIGSMSIQMISLKKDFATFMRQSDVRIELLREVVERIQRGEKVDVERALGTDDPEKELSWEQVLREIEKEDLSRGSKKHKKPIEAPVFKATETSPAESVSTPVKTRSTANFY